MSKVKIVLNQQGIVGLLRSEEMQQECLHQADIVINKLGSGYTADVMAGKKRAIARITASTPQTYQDNLDNNTLIKALG